MEKISLNTLYSNAFYENLLNYAQKSVNFGCLLEQINKNDIIHSRPWGLG